MHACIILIRPRFINASSHSMWRRFHYFILPARRLSLIKKFATPPSYANCVQAFICASLPLANFMGRSGDETQRRRLSAHTSRVKYQTAVYIIDTIIGPKITRKTCVKICRERDAVFFFGCLFIFRAQITENCTNSDFCSHCTNHCNVNNRNCLQTHIEPDTRAHRRHRNKLKIHEAEGEWKKSFPAFCWRAFRLTRYWKFRPSVYRFSARP